MTRYVPIDLHRRRSVVMHMDASGEVLGWQRLANDPETLVAEIRKSGEDAEVAIEATYGWYWAVDAIEQAGYRVHLVAPSLVAGFEGRRVKNDQRDCQLLGDLLRANMLPEAWIAPPQVRADPTGGAAGGASSRTELHLGTLNYPSARRQCQVDEG